MRIAVVGASGVVGQALIQSLLEDTSHSVVALSRSRVQSRHPEATHRLEWRACDLHNLLDLEAGLNGVDGAIYLVHSMLPGARLNQGYFSDFDLSLADNFARTAAKLAIKKVVYLSGLIPQDEELSHHLRSRLEVEETLRYYIPGLICLRAGMIIGPYGSSFQVVYRLVRRLPIMFCPKWARNMSQMVALDDVVRALARALERQEIVGQTLDLGGEPPMSYQQILEGTARLLGKKRIILNIPMVSLGLSKLWVRLISGAPPELIYPLVDSLACSMTVRAQSRWTEPGRDFLTFDQAVHRAIEGMRDPSQHMPHAFRPATRLSKQNTVRSIQRLPLPEGKDAIWVAEQYMSALPRAFPFLIQVLREGALVYLQLRFLGWNLLVLEYSPARSSTDRQLFYVRGGMLAAPGNDKARLELRETLGGRFCLAAVHDFRPALPWLIYRLTQAELHRWFMERFGRKLAARHIPS